MEITKEDKILIERAKEIIIKSKRIKLIDTAKVGSALITQDGNIYSGVSIGFNCGIGSCGEYQAIGSMVSNGENKIKTIVAVEYNNKTKLYDIIPPCGKCREMISQAAKQNKETYVIISNSNKIKLKDLLPHPWGGSIER